MTIDSFLVQLCQHCGIAQEQVSVEVTQHDEVVEVQLSMPEEESGRFIGYHGDALQATQRVLRLAFEQQYPDQKIVLNVNDYRERRTAQLEEKVRRVAEQVLADGRPYTFPSFIPSHERYAIHTALASIAGGDKLESYSRGEGMARRLTIALKRDEATEAGGAMSEGATVEGEERVDEELVDAGLVRADQTDEDRAGD